jgi:hypothetical protein
MHNAIEMVSLKEELIGLEWPQPLPVYCLFIIADHLSTQFDYKCIIVHRHGFIVCISSNDRENAREKL